MTWYGNELNVTHLVMCRAVMLLYLYKSSLYSFLKKKPWHTILFKPAPWAKNTTPDLGSTEASSPWHTSSHCPIGFLPSQYILYLPAAALAIGTLPSCYPPKTELQRQDEKTVKAIHNSTQWTMFWVGVRSAYTRLRGWIQSLLQERHRHDGAWHLSWAKLLLCLEIPTAGTQTEKTRCEIVLSWICKYTDMWAL